MTLSSSAFRVLEEFSRHKGSRLMVSASSLHVEVPACRSFHLVGAFSILIARIGHHQSMLLALRSHERVCLFPMMICSNFVPRVRGPQRARIAFGLQIKLIDSGLMKSRHR